MKKLLYIPILILVLAGCKKEVHDISTPAATDTTTTIGTGGNDGQVPAAGQFTGVNLSIPDQKLDMALSGASLTITYNEDVILLTRTASLQKSYAVHFKEDFSASDLKNFDFHSVTREGTNAYNWVDDNLNNINKTMKDTVINNIAITKIEIARTFIFDHTYSNPDEARAEYDKLLADKNQSISFSAWYAPVDPNIPTGIGKATMIYQENK